MNDLRPWSVACIGRALSRNNAVETGERDRPGRSVRRLAEQTGQWIPLTEWRAKATAACTSAVVRRAVSVERGRTRRAATSSAASSSAKTSRKLGGPCEPFRRCTRRVRRSATTATAKQIRALSRRAVHQANKPFRVATCFLNANGDGAVGSTLAGRSPGDDLNRPGLNKPFKMSGSPREGTRPTRFSRKSICIVGPVPSPGGFFNGLLSVRNKIEQQTADRRR